MKKNFPTLLLILSLVLNLVLGGMLLRQRAQKLDYLSDFYTSISYAATCTDRWQQSDDPHDSAGTVTAIYLRNAYRSAQFVDDADWPYGLCSEFFELQNFVICYPEIVHPHARHLTSVLTGLGSASYMQQNEDAAIEELRQFIDILHREVSASADP